MFVEYVEFDTDSDGRGLMDLVCDNLSGFRYFVSVGVFTNRNRLHIDLTACKLHGVIDANGDEHYHNINPRQIIEDALRETGVKTKLKLEFQKHLKGIK